VLILLETPDGVQIAHSAVLLLFDASGTCSFWPLSFGVELRCCDVVSTYVTARVVTCPIARLTSAVQMAAAEDMAATCEV